MRQIVFQILIFCFVFSSSAQIDFDESEEISYKANLIFQYGGESKLTLLPKINFIRIHQKNFFKPYYGVELGVHPLFIAGAFTFTAMSGVEFKNIQIESSISHFRTTKVSDPDGGQNGPYAQNLLNLKLGYNISRFSIKVGTSFPINDNLPKGDERIPLFDLGVINGQIYGIELQYRIN